MRISFKVLLVACLLASPGRAKADATYAYTGQPFTGFSGTEACTAGVGECSISVSFTVASPLPNNLPLFTSLAIPFFMTDGVHTVTATSGDLYVGTGPDGQIDGWEITATALGGQFFTILQTDYDPLVISFGNDYSDTLESYSGGSFQTGLASNSDDLGTWTVTTTPEPSSLTLLGMGFLGMAGASRWKKLQ